MAKAKKLPSGKWRTLVYVGIDSDGKRSYKSFTAETKRESEYLAAQYANGIKHKNVMDITLDEAIERYIKSKSMLSPATIRGYESMRRIYFGSIKTTKLRDLTQEKIQAEISTIAKTHSPKSVRNAHGFISAVISMFVPEMKLSTTLPQKEDNERNIPTEDEFKRFLEHIRGTEVEIYVLLAAVGSLRRSEIAALTDQDVLDNGVRVNKAMVPGPDHQWHIKPPKTTSSNRIAPLPPQIIAKLRQTHLGNTDPDRISRQFRKAIQTADIPHFTFHALRHYFASILHAEGVPDKYIMQFGGWQTDTVLKSVYQHAMRDKAQEESQIVTDIFSRMVK